MFALPRGAPCTPRRRDPHWILSHGKAHLCWTVLAFSLHWRGLQRLTKIFARVWRAPRCTCLVTWTDPGPASLSFRRFGASNGAAPVPIGPAVWPPEAEMLEQTNRQTNSQTFPANFFFATLPRTRGRHCFMALPWDQNWRICHSARAG